MSIFSLNLPAKEAFSVPSLFKIGEYIIYFWSNENNEPIHVHISKGRPTPNGTKIWLCANGSCIVAHNKSRIPAPVLNNMMDVIAAQFFMICSKWKECFRVDDVTFYC